MALYTVRHQANSGVGPVYLVDADSPQQAQARSPGPASAVRSVRRHWREWLRLRAVPIGEQRLLLAQMSVRLSRGGSSMQEYERIIDRLPALKRNRDRARVPSLIDLAPHEILLHLNAHPFVVLLCREGERLGAIPALLLRAIQFLDLRQKISEELHGPLLRAGLYALTAVFLFGLMPFLFEAALAGLSERIHVQTNLATDILLGIHAMLTDHLWVTLGGIVATGFLSVRLWDHLRKLPVARDFDGLVRARRSYMLLTVLAPTFRKGIHLADLMHSLQGLLGHSCSEYLYRRLHAGHRLSDSLPERYFVRSLITGLHRFEDTPAKNLAELFAAVQINLDAELRWHTTHIVRWTRWFYIILIILLLVLMMQGFLLPLYSLSLR